MADFAGIRGTANVRGPDYTERPQNFREMILWSNPNGMTPLTALMAKAKSESTDDPTFNWWEESRNLVRVQITGTLPGSTGSTTITLKEGGLKLVAGDILRIEQADAAVYDDEVIRVTTVSSDTSVVVVRAQAGTSDAASAADGFMTKIGNAFMEGAAAPDISSRTPTMYTNHCQIFRTSVGETGTMMATRLRTGDAWKNDKLRKSFDHSVAMELAFLLGPGRAVDGTTNNISYGSVDTSGTHPRRYTGGLRKMINSNVTVFATTPTEDTLLNAFSPVFDRDAGGAGDERIAFLGNGALNAINQIIKNSSSTQIQYDGEIDVFGLKLFKYRIPQGTIAFKSHPLLNTHPRYTYSMFVINPMGLRYRYLRDTRFRDNIQNNDADERKGEWLSECGLELNHEETFAYLGNITNP